MTISTSFWKWFPDLTAVWVKHFIKSPPIIHNYNKKCSEPQQVSQYLWKEFLAKDLSPEMLTPFLFSPLLPFLFVSFQTFIISHLWFSSIITPLFTLNLCLLVREVNPSYSSYNDLILYHFKKGRLGFPKYFLQIIFSSTSNFNISVFSIMPLHWDMNMVHCVLTMALTSYLYHPKQLPCS